MSKDEVQRILDLSENYSGSDIKVLCKEAAMGPVLLFFILESLIDSWNYWFGESGSKEYSRYSI